MTTVIRIEKDDVTIHKFVDNAVLIKILGKDLEIVLSSELVDELYNDFKELKEIN